MKGMRGTDSEIKQKTWLCRSPTSFQVFFSVCERGAAAAASETAQAADAHGVVPSP